MFFRRHRPQNPTSVTATMLGGDLSFIMVKCGYMARRILKYAGIICGTVLVSLFVQSAGNFPDPDSFYHAGTVSLLSDAGIVRNFPWLQFTVLKETYVDHHLLYHLAAVPLLKYFDPLEALRILSFIFAAAAVTAFFYLQESRKMRLAAVSTAILLSSSVFLARINLAKGVAPVLALFFLLLWAIMARKEKIVFVLSFIYPWIYAGWLVALALPFINMLASGLSAGSASPKNFLSAAFGRDNLKILAAVLLGLGLGIITNPYFPDNLWFTWVQAVKIGLINYQSRISVGQEWYPTGLGELLGNTSLAILFFIVSLVAFFSAIQKNNFLSGEAGKKMAGETMFLSLLAGIFFVLTLKSRRSAEYFIPLALLASSWIAEAAFLARPELLSDGRAFLKRTFWTRAFAAYFGLAVLFIAGRDINAVRKYFDKGFAPDTYRAASAVIEENSAPGDIVFNAVWDEFAMLFYWNRKQYYLAGLDPTFFYEFNPELYDDWFEAISGRYEGDLTELISGKFGAKIVFVSSRYGKMRERLKEDGRFKLIYDDKTSSVFKLR